MQVLASSTNSLKDLIEQAWERKQALNYQTEGEIRDAIEETLDALDSGSIRICEKQADGVWHVNEWAKKAILLSFRINDMQLIDGGPATGMECSFWYDKVPSKFQGWDETNFKKASFRAVPGCFVRKGAYIAKNVVLMPSFVNLGAYIDEGTMIDSWATVGSCAQIGKHCHISSSTCIGGVLEPIQATPVIIEDNCFVGTMCAVTEGVVVEQGAVLASGVQLSQSTKIMDRETGQISYGRVPAYSVVVPGTIPGKTAGSPAVYGAIIVKRVDEKTRSRTSVNELLREE